ncbi:MAG: helix-turn-helix domain-containing protein [Marmoricola sp.]
MDATETMTDAAPRNGTSTGRDRLRELLDAVLDEDNATLDEMADGAFASSYHFSRQLTRGAGEPPVTMKRRVLLERAAWRLRHGARVTDVAFEAGYESVEGFTRAFSRSFGHPPSKTPDQDAGHWLPAPNGIHFHPPTSLWVDSRAAAGTGDTSNEVMAQLVMHDLDDTRALIHLLADVTEEEARRRVLPGNTVLAWDGPEECLAEILEHIVWSKEVWVASMTGADLPALSRDDLQTLAQRHDDVAPRWLAVVRDIDRRGAWQDRLVDALCDPPESFVIGSVVAHVLTFAAHRRQLARQVLRTLGHTVDQGDPIDWLHRRTRGEA